MLVWQNGTAKGGEAKTPASLLPPYLGKLANKREDKEPSQAKIGHERTRQSRRDESGESSDGGDEMRMVNTQADGRVRE